MEAKLRDVSFQIGTDEILPPNGARFIRKGKETIGIAASEPVFENTIFLLVSHFGNQERSKVDQADASCQRFRSVL